MNFFWTKPKSPSSSISALIEILDNGDKEQLETLLWRPRKNRINYLPVTFDMLLKLKRPVKVFEKISVFKTHLTKHFTLVIFNVPWATDDLKFSPVIIETSTSKIVGIMLPFNELTEVLNEKRLKEITDLGFIWVRFTVNQRVNPKNVDQLN